MSAPRKASQLSAAQRESAEAAVARLADDCRQCYQCGQCTSACPNGWDFEQGPRQVVGMVLSEQVDDLMTCEDVWRCNECGTCTRNCPMEVDTMAVLAAVRQMQRDLGSIRCPERAAAEIADWWLDRAGSIDNIAFGAAMVSRGHLPRDPIGTVGQGTAAARSLLTRAAARAVEMTGIDRKVPVAGQKGPVRFSTSGTSASPAGATTSNAPGSVEATAAGAGATGTQPLPFFTGCSLPQDPTSAAATRDVAAGLGLALDELRSAGCCGHPARGPHEANITADGPVLTVCPACDASLREVGVEPVPLWEALVERARKSGQGLQAAAPAFVPYIGCLVDREGGLETMRRSAELAGAEMVMSYPSLHASCCGALGGMFRGESTGSRRLVEFAAAHRAPIVTTCLLCRDNIRSSARRNGRAVEVHFWPEFFTAAPAGVAQRGASAAPAAATLGESHA
jgi:Fe-S oxidoreductase